MTGGTEKAGTLDKDTAVPASSSILPPTKFHALNGWKPISMYLGCGNPAPFRRFAVSKLTMFFIVV